VHLAAGKESGVASMVVLDLMGGVALLLWGLHMVRSGIMRAFGSELRRFLGSVLRNRWLAFLAGVGVTALLQSSTATALMATSFAARGLLALVPALALMLGANVGTTLIVQALSFNVSAVAPVLFLLGVGAFKLGGRTATRDLGRVAIGLGFMLLVPHILLDTLAPAEQAPGARALLSAITGEPVLCVVIAALLTWAAHSSAAIVLLVMPLAYSQFITPVAALALVLGANLGSAINPILEGASADPASRRLPVGNLVNWLVGVVLVLPFLAHIAGFIARFEPNPARMAADFHTAFNLALALAFIFLLDSEARLLAWLLPERTKSADASAPLYLDQTAIDTPSVALACAAREVLHMGDLTEAMLRQGMTALMSNDRKLAAEVSRMDNAFDRLDEAVRLYVTKVTRESLDDADGRRAMEIISFAINLEHIGDIIDKNLMELAAKKIKHKYQFSRGAPGRRRRAPASAAVDVAVVGWARLALKAGALHVYESRPWHTGTTVMPSKVRHKMLRRVLRLAPRRASGQEFRHLAPRLVGRKRRREGVDAGADRGAQRQILPGADQLLLLPHRMGAGGEDRPDHVLDRGIELGGRHDALDQPPGGGLGGGEGFPEQQNLACPSPADQHRQEGRLDHRRNAELDLGHAELRGLHRHAQVAGRRNLEAGAEREAVDAGDHRDRQLARRVAAAMHPGDEAPGGRGVERRHLVDVGAADEGPVAGAGQHHAAQRLVAGEIVERRDEVRHQRTVQRVELPDIVDRHMGDAGTARALVDADDDASLGSGRHGAVTPDVSCGNAHPAASGMPRSMMLTLRASDCQTHGVGCGEVVLSTRPVRQPKCPTQEHPAPESDAARETSMQDHSTPAKVVKMYSDFKSPYAYLGFDPGMALGEKFDVRVRWIPFQLRIKGKGERSVYSEYKVKYSYLDARRWAKPRGLWIRGPLRIYDSTPAAIGGLFAETQGRLIDYCRAVFKAFFLREIEIDQPEAVAGAIAGLGLSAQDYLAYHKGEGRQAYERAQEEAAADHVFGVPFFIFEDEPFWGHDRIAALEQRLTEAGLARKEEVSAA